MFTHVTVGSDDIARSRTFYDALFGAMGADAGMEDAKGRLIYAHKDAHFLVTRPIDGGAASCGNGSTIGFAMDDPGQVDAWHKAGADHGGTPIEDPPGIRSVGGGREFYLAYLRDPDGNKLCAFHRVGG